MASSESIWEKEILPQHERYIRIPNKSPAFEPEWVKKGHMDQAVKLISDWAQTQAAHIPGLKVEVVRLQNEKGEPRTPVIVSLPSVARAARSAIICSVVSRPRYQRAPPTTTLVATRPIATRRGQRLVFGAGALAGGGGVVLWSSIRT